MKKVDKVVYWSCIEWNGVLNNFEVYYTSGLENIPIPSIEEVH